MEQNIDSKLEDFREKEKEKEEEQKQKILERFPLKNKHGKRYRKIQMKFPLNAEKMKTTTQKQVQAQFSYIVNQRKMFKQAKKGGSVDVQDEPLNPRLLDQSRIGLIVDTQLRSMVQAFLRDCRNAKGLPPILEILQAQNKDLGAELTVILAQLPKHCSNTLFKDNVITGCEVLLNEDEARRGIYSKGFLRGLSEAKNKLICSRCKKGYDKQVEDFLVYTNPDGVSCCVSEQCISKFECLCMSCETAERAKAEN